MKVFKFLGRTDKGEFIFDSRRAAKKFGCHTIFGVWRTNQFSLNHHRWWARDFEADWFMPVSGVKWKENYWK